MLPLGWRAGRGQAGRRCRGPGRRSLRAHRAQDLRAQGRGRALCAQRDAPGSHPVRRPPRARSQTRHRERSRRRRPRRGGPVVPGQPGGRDRAPARPARPPRGWHSPARPPLGRKLRQRATHSQHLQYLFRRPGRRGASHRARLARLRRLGRRGLLERRRRAFPRAHRHRPRSRARARFDPFFAGPLEHTPNRSTRSSTPWPLAHTSMPA